MGKHAKMKQKKTEDFLYKLFRKLPNGRWTMILYVMMVVYYAEDINAVLQDNNVQLGANLPFEADKIQANGGDSRSYNSANDRFTPDVSHVGHRFRKFGEKRGIQPKLLDLKKRKLSRNKRNIGRQPAAANDRISTSPRNCRIIIRHYRSLKRMKTFECAPSLINLISKAESRRNNGTIYRLANTTVVSRKIRQVYAINDVTSQFGVPDDVTELRLWHQRIVSIETDAFHILRVLTSLKLQHNFISYLSRDAFSGLTDLVELDLSYNRLQSIRNNVFVHLTNLEILRLNHNEITTVQNAMFCGLASLATLDLSHNAINDIEPHALRHFKSTKTVLVELNYNKLKKPRIDWFQCTPNTLRDPICIQENGNTVIYDVIEYKSKNSTPVVGSKMDRAKILNDDNSPTNQTMSGRSQTKGNRYNQSKELCLRSIRIFRASYNPWSCTCDDTFDLLRFLRINNSTVTSQHHETKLADDNIGFQYSEIDSSKEDITPNETEHTTFYKTYFTMQCDTPEALKGVNLGDLSVSEKLGVKLSCCEEISRTKSSFENHDDVTRDVCKSINASQSEDSDSLSDNEVTIIGIVIVFVTPVLLTLCPDCDRTVFPAGGGGMKSAGKFGAMPNNNKNNNNNNDYDSYPDSNEIFRTSEPIPSQTNRSCGLVQTKSTNKLYKEDMV